MTKKKHVELDTITFPDMEFHIKRNGDDVLEETPVNVVDDDGEVVETIAGPIDEYYDINDLLGLADQEFTFTQSPPEKKEIYTGGTSDYYKATVLHPTSADIQPYVAECNDIIEALGMSFAEGNVFKAIWRSCAMRNTGAPQKKGYDNGLYDAEKIVYYGERMVIKAKRG